jgi:hypothetical protein
MIEAKIVITVKYAPDADMEEATQDKKNLFLALIHSISNSIPSKEDLQIDYSLAEIEEIKKT